MTRTVYGLPITPLGGEHLDSRPTAADLASAGDYGDENDLVEWVASQPWSNGRVGVFGDSALGMTAALAAAAQPPALDAVFVQAAPADPFGIDMTPEGGGLKVETLLLQGTSLAFVELAVQGTAKDLLRADGMAELVAPPLVVHLTADGGLGTPDDGVPTEVAFTSDPADPVPTLGGRNLLAAAGTGDHAALIGRGDTALFRLAPTPVGTLISGHVSARLTVRTDAPSFDVGARLLDIAPDGTARLVLSHLARVAVAVPGETQIAIDLGTIAHRVPAGHRIALLLAGSDVPAWDRNPQTGGDLFTSVEMRPARLAIVTGRMASTLALPLAASN